jgi:hypothetical protein
MGFYRTLSRIMALSSLTAKDWKTKGPDLKSVLTVGFGVVGTARFERATPASRTLCSTRLSHVPTDIFF